MVPELQFRSHHGSVRGHSSDPKKCGCGVTPVPSPIPETRLGGAVSPLGPHRTAGAGTVPGYCLIKAPIMDVFELNIARMRSSQKATLESGPSRPSIFIKV